ncbi:MAG: UDP-N-acetylglucosamine 1-carboxyvinyltransferase [Pontixanthobacter sp.]
MKAIISGGTRPKGTVQVSGAKNSATRLLAAALLSDETVTLSNFPTRLVDVGHKVRFICAMGGKVELDHDRNEAIIDASSYSASELPTFEVPIRTTYLLAAGQIMRSGKAVIPYPGGCKIGSRGYDMHVLVWEQLGCKVTETEECIKIEGKGFQGNTISFPISTVGGTENALICGAIASGTTEIVNAYITPEVEDLISLLKHMGSEIVVSGNSHISIKGRTQLMGAHARVMPDRIEALTWIVYGILSRGNILIEDVPFDTMQAPFLYLQSAGLDMLANSNSIYIRSDDSGNNLVKPVEVPCGAYPGVISDMQPFFVLLAMAASGISRIHDYRYPERIGYIDELSKFCETGKLQSEHGKILVEGPIKFQPATARSTDLRGSMALILAALCADGKSKVHDAEMALRGYNDLQGKLAKLGVTIEVVE